MTLEPEDLAPLLDEVERFARERVATLAGRPETPMAVDAFVTLGAEARDLGLLPAPGSVGGYGLWQGTASATAVAFGLGALRHIARADAGVAFAWHRAALAAFVEETIGLAPAGTDTTTLVVGGPTGLARAGLVDWLAGRPLDDEAEDRLAAGFDRRATATVVVAPETWEHLLWPVWTGSGLVWERAARADLEVETHRGQHGFDALCGFRVRRPRAVDADQGPADAASARRALAGAIRLDLLGLLAIGAGALDHGRRLARDYAAMRRQGGRRIVEHPAVALLLGEIDAALHAADRELAAAARGLDDLDLHAIVLGRIATAEALARGAGQVMQVFGGIGYMRDTGAEKILRDVNMLRMQTGGLLDTRLFAAELAGATA